MILTNTLLHSDNGFIELSHVADRSHCYNANTKLAKVEMNVKTTVKANGYKLTDSLHSLPFTLLASDVIEAVTSLSKERIPVSKLQVGDWIFHPWVKNANTSIYSTIDLSKYTDNLRNSTTLFVLNHQILSIADHFNIQPSVLKEVLIREAAEYEEYIEPVKQYIEEHYCAYDKFFEYVEKEFTYKMPRFVTTQSEDFVTFLAAVILYSKDNLNLINQQNNKTSYRISFRIPVKDKERFIPSLKRLCKNYNVKYTEPEDYKGFSMFHLNNKPFYQLITKHLKYSLHNLKNAPVSLQEHFISLIGNNPLHGSLRLLLELIEFYHFNKRVVGLRQRDNVPYLVHVQDELDSLYTDLIIDEDGYYSQVRSKDLTHVKEIYKIKTFDKSYITLSYVKHG